MIICASGFYTVVCDQSSKTPSWYCLLHLLYTKDTNIFPALQVQTPTAPPPSGPSQVRCRNFWFQSTVVCDQSSKTPRWYCLLHLLYTKDTNALPALQVETPTAPPPSGPAQVRCRHFRFQSVAVNKKAKISLRYLSQFTRQKKEKEEEKKEAVQCRKPEPQRFN